MLNDVIFSEEVSITLENDINQLHNNNFFNNYYMLSSKIFSKEEFSNMRSPNFNRSSVLA